MAALDWAKAASRLAKALGALPGRMPRMLKGRALRTVRGVDRCGREVEVRCVRKCVKNGREVVWMRLGQGPFRPGASI